MESRSPCHRAAEKRKSQNWNLISKRVGQPIPRNWGETEKANIPFLSCIPPSPLNRRIIRGTYLSKKLHGRTAQKEIRGGVNPMTLSLLRARYVQPRPTSNQRRWKERTEEEESEDKEEEVQEEIKEKKRKERKKISQARSIKYKQRQRRDSA